MARYPPYVSLDGFWIADVTASKRSYYAHLLNLFRAKNFTTAHYAAGMDIDFQSLLNAEDSIIAKNDIPDRNLIERAGRAGEDWRTKTKPLSAVLQQSHAVLSRVKPQKDAYGLAQSKNESHIEGKRLDEGRERATTLAEQKVHQGQQHQDGDQPDGWWLKKRRALAAKIKGELNEYITRVKDTMHSHKPHMSSRRSVMPDAEELTSQVSGCLLSWMKKRGVEKREDRFHEDFEKRQAWFNRYYG